MSHATDARSSVPDPITAPSVRVPVAAQVAADVTGSCRSVLGTYPECPMCGGDLFPEHAHFRCGGCGWRDSCCD
jgi:hypothetical protein